jgi:hypothetical protein
MSLRLPTRTLVPVVALAMLGGIVAMLMVARLPEAADEPALVRPKLAKTAAVQAPVRAKPRKAAPVRKPVVVPVAKAPVAPVRKPVARPVRDPVGRNGLPLVVSRALAKNRVAVVALYDPRAGVDAIALAEARAGAESAGARFVAINVFNERQSRPLANLLGVLKNPAVLVFHRPDTLYVQLTGFSDRDTVAQAAANAGR